MMINKSLICMPILYICIPTVTCLRGPGRKCLLVLPKTAPSSGIVPASSQALLSFTAEETKAKEGKRARPGSEAQT